VDGKILTIKRQALGWSGVEEARDASGTVALRYGQHELGQLDLAEGLADLPVPEELRTSCYLRAGSCRTGKAPKGT